MSAERDPPEASLPGCGWPSPIPPPHFLLWSSLWASVLTPPREGPALPDGAALTASFHFITRRRRLLRCWGSGLQRTWFGGHGSACSGARKQSRALMRGGCGPEGRTAGRGHLGRARRQGVSCVVCWALGVACCARGRQPALPGAREEPQAGRQPPGSWTPSASDTLSACANDGP